MLALAILNGCAALDHGILNAQGPVASHERHLLLLVSGILLFVWVPVVILVPLIAWHYRRSNTNDAYRPKWAFSWTLEGFIWIPPIGIVVLLAILLWPATQRDDPYTRRAGQGEPVRVQAIALNWKWVFIYPGEGVATVNQLAVPAGRPIHVSLTSGTVMQSLLLPQLAGQVYAMAGMRTRMNFAVDRPGIFRGENTQFSGEKFAQQKFPVISMTGPAYAAWLARARGTGRPLDQRAWAALSRQNTTGPQTFSAVPPKFFDHVIAATGGASHPHAGHRSAMRKAS
ncbi:cytochrome bo3 quinol oxidase subunit 2 [Sphingomonas palmae]|uniref:Cytochrome bo3 quinol oxidase subunit 2 n=1 Tax=Sphingomonas palmae TaxID=1855283 RepID=A0A1H7TT95_9SPHN|nr:cytochrome ubiquinol oxidase subunit II [Sphingomonas palmae]SEL87719.1 cytochrome bo3 quinol oxidase subunit 2 [Sphingomonas palmae]